MSLISTSGLTRSSASRPSPTDAAVVTSARHCASTAVSHSRTSASSSTTSTRTPSSTGCQSYRIPEHATVPEAGEHGLELDTLRLGRRTDDVQGRLDYLREIDGLNLETQLARHHARDIEQVLDEPFLRLRAALDRLECMRGLPGIETSAAQQVGPGEDRPKGRA